MASRTTKQLLKFVKERESIRLKRERGLPPPWTKDKILAQYRFCNIRRSDDRVSRWFRQNVLRQEYIDLDLGSFLLFTGLCRYVNWPPTIKAIMDAKLWPRKKPNWKKIGALIDKLASEGKAWTGAYMIRAPKKGGKKGSFIAEQTIGKEMAKVVPQLVAYFKNQVPAGRSCAVVWNTLRKGNGFGSFMTGQIVADWSYCGLLAEAYDLKTWAPMGPGSIRGYNRLVGITPIKKRPKEDVWLAKLQECHQLIVSELGPDYQGMTLMDVQNIFCENDKLQRVLLNQGRPRANYRPHEYPL